MLKMYKINRVEMLVCEFGGKAGGSGFLSIWGNVIF